ncbi:hypothetical protein HWV62_27025, partial [Athelia sp. TMB]
MFNARVWPMWWHRLDGRDYLHSGPGGGGGTTSSTKVSTTTSKSSTTSSKPTTSGTGTSTSTSTGPSSSPSAVAGNPYTGYNVFLSPPYVAEVQAAAATITNAALAAKALEVAKVPNFIWFDQVAKVPSLGTYLAAAEAQAKSTGTPQLVQIVVYDLPDRDCAAKASNGEFQVNNGGQALYFNYIDQLVAQIKAYPSVRVVAVIEPDSLANLVTNLSVAECSAAEATYKA